MFSRKAKNARMFFTTDPIKEVKSINEQETLTLPKTNPYFFALQWFPYEKEKSDSTYSIPLCSLQHKILNHSPL